MSHQGVLEDLFTAPRRHFRQPARWVVVLAALALVCWPGQPVGVALPVALVVIGVINLVALARASGLLSAGELTELCESTPRQVTVGDLVRAGRTVAMRLPDEGRWLVARLPATDVPALARLRRIWVFGPSPAGRVGLIVPGGSGPRLARLADAPPSGAEPVPAPAASPAAWPPAPEDDLALRLAVRTRNTVLLTQLVVGIPTVAVLMVLDSTVFRAPGGSLTTLWFYGFCLILALVPALSAIVRYARAARATRWTWTRVEPGETKLLFQAWLQVQVRVPQNNTNLLVAGPPALVLAIAETGQLWIPGELRATGRMVAGIPEVPVLGQIRVARQTS